MSNGLPGDPDDYFADTRMSFGDHIEELRTHLWRAIFGFLVALCFSFFIGKAVMNFITAPVKAQLDRFYDKRVNIVLKEKAGELNRLTKASEFRKVFFLKDQLRDVARGVEPDPRRPIVQNEQEAKEQEEPLPWLQRLFLGKQDPKEQLAIREDFQGESRIIPESQKSNEIVGVWMSIENPLFFTSDTVGSIREILQVDSPTTLRAEEAFFVWFKVCLVTGFVLGSPWIFWQIWMFIAAGLYPEEKRLVHYYLPVSLGLFLFGVFICEMFVIPKALEALLWFNEWLGFKPDIRLNDWLSFAILMPLVFGLSFQTPMVMIFLNRLGIMGPDSFREKRRYAWFGMAIFSAFISPSVDAISMLFLWVPMGLLYELGIFLMKFNAPPSFEDEESDADELIEV